MNAKRYVLPWMLAFAVLGTGSASAAQKTEPGKFYSLTVTVTGAKEPSGLVRAALFNGTDAFPDGKATGRAQASLKGQKAVRLVFKHLPPGAYAISLYHDANSNNKFDQAVFGIPKESYGFSNIHSAVIAKPKFDDAKFDLQKNMSMTIELLGP